MSDAANAAANAGDQPTLAPTVEGAPNGGAPNTETQNQGHGDPSHNAGTDTGAADPGEGQEGGEPEWLRKRIDRHTRKQREAEREAAYWRGQAEQANRQPQRQDGQQQGNQPAPLPVDLAAYVGQEPRPEAFNAGEFDPAYLRAVAAFDRKNDEAQRELKQRQGRQQQAQASVAQSWAKQAEAGAARYSDFAEKVYAIPISPAMAEAITEGEHGAEVAYWLGSNAEEARRIAALPPIKQAREIGRLDARLTAEREAASRQRSNAPNPARTVAGGGGAASTVPSWDLPMDQFAAREVKRWTR